MYGYNDKSLKVSLILCPFSRVREEGSPLGTMTCPATVSISLLVVSGMVSTCKAGLQTQSESRWFSHGICGAMAPVAVAWQAGDRSCRGSQLGQTDGYFTPPVVCTAPTAFER